jgi:UDP:flavonoid glycosyltransferase YjiC (YdhE family)
MRMFCRRAGHDAADLQRAIGHAAPDALLVDINARGAMAAAEAWGGPWASWCPFPLPLPSRDAPPFGPGLKPAAGPAGRLRDAVLRPVVFGSLMRIVLPGVNQVRDHAGVPPLQDASAMFTAPPLLLYLTAEPFEYHRSDWPPNIHLVGPCDWDPPAEPPPWLAEIHQPTVLVTTSSETQDDARLVRCALDALAGEDICVVATLPAANPAGFRVPPNARVLPFTPHARSSTGPPAPSPTAAWARPRRHSPAASPSAPSLSAATSSKSPAASR